MKKIILGIICLLFSVTVACAYTIQAGVSVDKVPKTLFGSWQVEAQLIETNASGTFKPKSTDLWNLSRYGNVLNLENPFTGAKASVDLKIDIVSLSSRGTFVGSNPVKSNNIRIIVGSS